VGAGGVRQKIILKDWLTCSEVVDVDKTNGADGVTWKLLGSYLEVARAGRRACSKK
jgi:hypothetical protein